MNKQLFLSILLLSLIDLSVFAQTKSLINEQFDTNKNDWQTFSNQYYDAKVESGVYFLRCKQNYSKNFYKYFYINPKQDFSIKSTMTITEQQQKNYGYGLVWGSSYSKQYYFIISKNGYYLIYEYDSYKDKSTNLKDWTTSDLIKPLGESNTLSIEKSGNIMTFFINNQQVFSMPFKTFYGSNIGFSVPSLSTVKVDSYELKSQAVSIPLIANPNQDFKKENLGSNINSSTSELHPIISQDGKTLYFTRQDHPENLGTKKLQDSWYATRQGDTWSKAKNMGRPFNDEGHNSGVYISPDDNTFIIDNDVGDEIGDKQALYELHRTATGWSSPEEIKIDNYYNFNKYESYCLAANGKVLIMSIEREDTHGGEDLYVSFLRDNNTWTSPKNMGNDINTFGDDFTPFLAADGKTLYYSSQGLPGYGSADIYMTKRLDNTWTNWSKPKNLGAEINGSGWDAYYTIAASGEEAFLVSNGINGSSDIFKIKLAEAAKPEPVVLIKGRVFDEKAKQPIAAKIVYEDLKTGKKAGRASSNPQTGSYKIVLPYGTHYGFRAEAKNYIAISENIEITEQKDYIEVKRDLYLAPLKAGEVVELKNVFFERGKPVLLEKSYPELERLVEIMKEYPSLEIEISGHTDGVGNPVLLMKLSKLRAQRVVSYLVEHGIEQARIVAKGYGGTKPIASNASEATRKLNRRVEFKILKLE